MTRLRSFAAVMTISGATLLAQPPTAESTTLGRQTLSETTDPKMSLFFLNLAPGAIVPSHSHAGAVFAYVLQGDIENQIELEPPAVYHPGGFFEERPMQVHRMLRNLSRTEPAKILILQNTGSLPASIKPLLQEPIENLSHREVTVLTRAVAPGAEVAMLQAPVFAYVLRGEVAGEVAGEDKPYRAGDAFYTPENHTGLIRNASKSDPAEVILFQVAASAKPAWETLLSAPLAEDAEPKISVFSIPLGPASPTPPAAGPGHRHAGPVFAYVLQGEIENQVEPDPPQIYKAGGFFYEAPMHLHRFLRNRSQTEPVELIIFQAGDTGTPVPAIKLLFEQPLRATANQEISLLRLTLPASTSAEAGSLNDGVVYVLEGEIESAGKIHKPGDLFAAPASPSFRNAGPDPAKLLLYQVTAAR